MDTHLTQAALRRLARQHAGEWGAGDEAEHAAWLSADPAHAAAWLHAQEMWDELEEMRPLAADELRAARRASRPTRRTWRTGLMLAASAVLVAGLGVLQLPGAFSPAQIHQTARGERTTIYLADGSSVDLNTATRLAVDYGPTCRCLRLLQGEAVFHAVHGDLRGFKLRVDAGTVRDIGTVFWVRKTSDGASVAVLEGSVEIQARPGAAPARLDAGERSAFAADGNRPGETVPLSDLTAWREGLIVFRDASLGDVLGEFARYHDIRVEMDARLDRYRLSGRFASGDLDGLLQLLQTAYPVRVRRSGESLRLDYARG